MIQITALKNDFDPTFQVPNTFFRQEEQTKHLALILPGLNYSCDMPLLYYAAQVMLAAGADVVQVKYDYSQSQSGRGFSLKEILPRMRMDCVQTAQLALQQRDYEHLTLIGKSLGTLAIPLLLDAGLSVQPQICIFQTPILNEMLPALGSIRQCPHTLHVIGTQDPYYNPALIEEFRTPEHDNFMLVEGANHSLEIPWELMKSLTILENVVDRMREFIMGINLLLR